ncbi:serine/threonine-protein kinase [Undibacterium fentianense]|uniref:Protein kinase n=1 Tax=Undibacterium fentianense TaxID=2828728 RepID=A0A941E4G1_9BURK|nr:serine/threonine-protein kinase [Undibacterium fentianense]MBR7799558.1 protein kinase [Undibacterium fentianense]
MSVSKDNVAQPDQFLHYQLGKSLGEGGFGHVYQAWDAKLHRQVAIKYLKNFATGLDLLKEARLAASLQHAAFVKVHALEQAGESQAIVMELVPGRTLRQVLETQTPSISHVIDIVLQIAQAMQEAHAAGLVHGDLKPSNLMQEPSGVVRILDFGLATQADRDATTSLVQADPQGTIAYMAPEILTGAPLQASADIYALGVILYELLTGARPFASLSGLALAAAVIQSNSDQWPWPDNLPLVLRQLVRAMTTRQIEHRIGTMQEVANQCAQIAAIDAVSLNSGTFNLSALKLSVPLVPENKKFNWSGFVKNSRRTGLTVLLVSAMIGAWYSQPYWPQMREGLQTYSESREMQLGLDALNNFDRVAMLDRAEQHFQRIIDRSPNHAAAIASLSLVHSQRYLTDRQNTVWLQKAESEAKQAVDSNDFLALSHVAMAKVYELQDQFQDAFADIERALALDPNSVLAISAQIEVLIRAGRLDEALTKVKLVQKNHPSERIFADQMAKIYLAQNDFKAAEIAYRLSLQIKPDASASYIGLAQTLLALNRAEDSIQELQTGIKIRPGAELFSALGNTLFTRGDYVGAANAFESAVSEDKGNPKDFQAWARLAESLSWLPGKADIAKSAYAKARNLLQGRLQITPHDANLISLMGLYTAKLGENAESLNFVQQALALAPNSAEIQFRAAVSYEMIDMRAQALAAIVKSKEFGYPNKLIEAEPELLALRRDPKYLR